MKKLIEKIRDFWFYVRDYSENRKKDNTEEKKHDNRLIEYQNKITALEKEIAEKDFKSKEKDNLVFLRDQRIQSISNKFSDVMKRNNELRKLFQDKCKEAEELKMKLENKEKQRIASAGTINSKQKKIENLEKKINELKELHKQELEKKDITIEFYKSKLPEPTLKELKDYKYKRKNSSDKYV